MNQAWTITGHGNVVLETDNLRVSYNPNTQPHPFVDGFLAPLLGQQSSGLEETALKIDDVWYILNGDFRAEYEQAFPDPIACLDVYHRNIQHRSNWSTDQTQPQLGEAT